MPDLEISNLPALAEAGVAATDPLAIADISASETKKVTVKDLIEAGLTFIDAASIPAAKIGTLGTDQVATGAIQDDAVTNAKLEHSTISLGGISLALGGTDATPAFNLTDATNYPTSSLTGTITNAQLAGSIANSKLANSSVSFGGILLSLGGTDATPAFNLTDATGYKTTNLVGTITNAQLAGSIDVSKLVGSNVGFGGVTVALGQSDATPAFNLTDATGYPASSLVGTITNAQLAGSIENAKLTNSSVSFGGITVALGASDPTPAFDLTDATNYPASSLSGTITNAQLAGSIAVSKLVSSSASIGGVTITLGTTDATPAFDLQDATGYPTSALVGTITNAQLAGSIAATKLVAGSITSTQLGANSVTDSELANNAVDTGAVQNGAITNDKVETSTSATTGLDGATKIRDASITPAKLNTSNLDRSLNVASGNLGINNAVSGGASTRSGISYNAEGLITGTVALAAADLPKATTSAVGGVSIGAGLSVTGAGALSITNSITANTTGAVKVTYNAQGQITGSSTLAAGDIPTATTSAKGGVQITSGGGLTVDGSGNLTTSTSGVGVGTYQSVTVNAKGVVTAGAGLTATLIPSLPASKITSGTIDAARIGTDSIDGSKLSNTSTAIFQSVAQQGYPTAQFSGQILFDTVSEDAWIWDGNAWQAITTLTKGSLVFGGNFNANTSKMTACTSAGLAAGLAVGSNLPTPSSTTDGLYVVVDTAGTPSAPAPVVAFSPPDYILGVTNASGSSWNEIDLSQTVAGQVASNITFTPYGQISSTNVQDALQELETEKLAKAGGTVTGEILISNTGSLVFEGSTVDAFETTLTVADPTTSDKTITFPDITGTVITSGDTGTVTSTMLANGTIVNADINASAAIAFSKLAALTSAQILVGNGSNVPTAVAVTGDISINNAGLTAIAAGAIVNADISGSAAIAGSKVASGSTSAAGVLQLVDSTTSTSTSLAATGASVKAAKDAADSAQTTANAALPKTGGTLTGNLILDNAKEVRFSEGDGDGSNYTGLKAQAQTGDITLTLPAVAPTANQVLKADASTPTTLTWAADSATDSTKMPLTGGTFTGDVTFTGDSSDGLWDKSESVFVANLTGNVTGNVSGSSGSCTGNAATATALATARNIGGVSFDGTAAIDLPGVNTAGTQDTSGTAALATEFTVTANNSTDETVYPLFADGATGSQGAETDTGLTYNPSSGLLTSTSFDGALTGNVTGNVSGSAATVTGAAQSAITSLGTLTGLTVDGDVTLTGAANNVVWDKSDNALGFADDAKATFGDSSDLSIYHDGTQNIINGAAGQNLEIQTNAFRVRNQADSESLIVANADDAVELYHDSSLRLNTTAAGIDVTGTAVVDGVTIDGAYEQVAEAVSALDIDLSTGNYFTKTINANSTFTFSNPASSGTTSAFTLELTHTSGTVTWPSEVKWNGDSAPTLTAGKTHLFMFVTDDGGSRYRGAALVDYVN